MLEDIEKKSQEKMQKCIDSLEAEMGKIRTGRAHASLLDHIKVESYGSKVPISQVATVSVEGARSLLVSPWDKSQLSACEKAIRQSDLGLNPASQGSCVRVPLPPLTEERRKDMIKLVKDIAEHGKVAIRNIRRHALQEVKTALKDKLITEDEEKVIHAKMNKITETYVDKADQYLHSKENELKEV